MKTYAIYDHVSAWKGCDVDKETFSEVLQEHHIHAMEKAMHRVRDKGLEVEDITRTDFPLDEISDSVARWIDIVQEGPGLLVLSGFPVSRFSKEECGLMYYGLGTHFGEAQSQSMLGDRLGHVVNVGGKDERERAYRNSLGLALHTDASDVVGMMCLVPAMSGGESGFCSAPAVYNRFVEQHPELLDVLFEGFRYHLFGEQLPGESPITEHNIPVFSTCDGYLSSGYLRSYIELAFEEMGQDKSTDQQRALDLFDEIAHSAEFRLDYMMEPGDISFFNNYVVLHTRKEFEDSDDPEQRRHLLRLWLRTWDPRPLAGNISTYKSRTGIARQQGKGTYYKGRARYTEVTVPESTESAEKVAP